MFIVCLMKSEVFFLYLFFALKILNQSFVDRSAPDFFRKPADTDIACGIILNMSCTVGSCHPSSMLISPMPICFDLTLNCRSIRLPAYLYFTPLHVSRLQMSALVPGAEVQGASESFAERGDATSLSVLQETWEDDVGD